MARSVYSWGKAAQDKKRRGGSSVKKPHAPKSPKAGVKKTKKIKTGY